MRKDTAKQLLAIFIVAVLAVGVAIYFFSTEKNTKSVKDGGVTGVIINEVMSSNSGFLPDQDGDFPDWIELYNPTDTAINLSGYGLSDDEGEPIKYALPDITIEPYGYLIVFASDKAISSTDAVFQHTNFKLSSDGDLIIFSNRAGEQLDRIDLGAIPTNQSVGRNPDDPELIETYTESTPGFENSAQGVLDYKASKIVENPELIITEVMTSNKTMVQDNNGEYSDWIEIYNQSAETVNLSNYYISDDPINPLSFILPDVELKGGEYYLIYASGDSNKTDDPADGVHADFRLSSFKETLVLSNLIGQTLDTVSISELASDRSYQRQMNSGSYSTAWETNLGPSPGFDNTDGGAARYRELHPLALGDIIISEVVLSNDQFAVESNGVYYDWIEIYNRGSATVNLTGYGLTDSTGNPGKWRFPDTTIRPGEYLVIQASGMGESGKTAEELKKKYLNTNFSLSLDGEIIALFDSDNHLLDRYAIEELPANTSIGRQGKSDTLFVFPVPTPGVMNTGGLVGYTSSPDFIDDPGFYAGSQSIRVEVPSGTTVYYTLDNSTPDTQSQVYSGAIPITETTVIRMIAQKEGHLPSNAVTGVFFIDEHHTLDVISIVTDPDNLWGDQGIYAVGNNVDMTNPGLSGTSFLVGPQSNVLSLDRADDLGAAYAAVENANYMTKDLEVPANFSLYEGGMQVFSQDIGIQLFGSFSRYEVQKSFAMYARGKYGDTEMAYSFFDNRDLTSYRALVARQSGNDCKYSRIRDIFMTSLMEQGGGDRVQVQAYRQCVLYLNGEYWGIYNLREKPNKYYAASRYYAPDPVNDIDFIKGNGLTLVGDNRDYKALEDFMDDNDIGIDENYEYVKSQMDVYNYMDWLIAEVYFYNSDDGNRKFYRVRTDDGLWRWILYDLDWGMWIT
ncbi:MAG: lamin tail domain-containing protein, partial [Eubacteriales bacterium]